ncbi:MAG: hypothetical protein HYT49_02200 [Candidatus Wildermuthbacteria bacterium]|nr:hypothetical protein [Candidatus Wildermuthbacteria bacterium]
METILNTIETGIFIGFSIGFSLFLTFIFYLIPEREGGIYLLFLLLIPELIFIAHLVGVFDGFNFSLLLIPAGIIALAFGLLLFPAIVYRNFKKSGG